MLIILYVGMYLLTGILAILGCALIHLYKAEKDGYAALDWWNNNNNQLIESIASTTTAAEVVCGLIIWPARLFDFIYVSVPMLMEQYELKSDGES